MVNKQSLLNMKNQSFNFSFMLHQESKERLVDSCSTLIKAIDDGFSSYSYPDQIADKALYIDCKTIDLLLTLRPSKVSYIDKNLATVDFAKATPPQLAMVISKDDQRQLAKATSWFEMDNIERVEKANHQIRFYDNAGGIHTLSIIAKGDFNNDGIEDVVISKFNTVKGGSYASSHGYVLTRLTSDGRYKLLKDI